MRYGRTVEPVNGVRIEDKLIFGLDIIENRHLLRTDDRQLLFFEGMEPAYKDVGLNSAAELARSQSCVDQLGIDVASALCRNSVGSFFQQEENCRDVMGRKAPQYVFFCSQLSEIQS